MKKVAIFLVEDFEPVEAVTPIDILTRGGVEVSVLSLTGDIVVNGANHVSILCDKVFAKNYLSDDNISYAYDFDEFDAIILPGGKGTSNYYEDKVFLAGVKKFFDDGKLIGAICQAPVVLHDIGILDKKVATCYPSFELKLKNAIYSVKDVEIDANVITSKSLSTSLEFSLAILRVLEGNDVCAGVSDSVTFDI